MLLVFAHPDDESFTCGGVIPKYVKEGWSVDLVCATRGEVGNTGEYGDMSEEELGKIRQKELEKAATLLGVTSITFLGYKDGTLADEPPGELEDAVYRKMEETIPDCVITFDTTGISNHPDHIKLCYATTFAFQKYAFFIKSKLGNAPNFDEESSPKLYYACVPRNIVSYLVKNKVFPEESFGKPWVGTEDKHVTTAIDVSEYADMKKDALRCHRSQTEDVDRFLSFAKNPLVGTEYFILRMHGIREVFMGKMDHIAPEL